MRTRGWAARLQALVLQRLQVPFAWGVNDCAGFAADVVLALHQRDTLAALRVPRATALQALRQQRALQGAAALDRCGLPRVAPAFATVGDLLLLRQRRRELLALCNGSEALAPGTEGLVALPLRQAVAAWRT